jgi:ribosome-interacting GTPase 1
MVTDGRGMTTVPLLVVANKDDDEEADEVLDIFLELLEGDWPLVAVSAAMPRNLDGLKQAVFDMLEIIRVYSKPPGRKPDLDTPFVLPRGSTVEDLAGKVHKDFLEGLKAARVWGSATHDGLMVGRDHVLADGDIVELRV